MRMGVLQGWLAAFGCLWVTGCGHVPDVHDAASVAKSAVQAAAPTAPAAAVRNQYASDPSQPRLNPSPRQVVKVFGALPKEFDMRMILVYEVTSRAPQCRNGDGPFAEPYFKKVRFDYRRDGDRYEGELVVDRFLPGQCGWAFHGTDLLVELVADSRQSASPGQVTIDGSRFDVPDTTAYCPPRSEWANCDEARQRSRASPDTRPVQVKCGIRTEGSDPNRGYFDCRDFAGRERYKLSQLLTRSTQTIQMDFVSLPVLPEQTVIE